MEEAPLVEVPPGHRYELRIVVKLRWRSFTHRESLMQASRIRNALVKLKSYLNRRWKIEMTFEMTQPVEVRKRSK